MFNFNKKNLIPLLVIISLLIFLSLSILVLSSPALTISRGPLGLVNLIQREIGGIIFYHRNQSENISLRKEIDFLRNKLNGLNEIYLENLRLKNNLSFKQKSGFKIIPARVIARPADNWSTGLIIDKGSSYGIRKGSPALTYLGLVGRVIETTD